LSCNEFIEVGVGEHATRPLAAVAELHITELARLDVGLERLDGAAELCRCLGHAAQPIGRGVARLALAGRPDGCWIRRWRCGRLQGDCELIEHAVIAATQCALDLRRELRGELWHGDAGIFAGNVELGRKDPSKREATAAARKQVAMSVMPVTLDWPGPLVVGNAPSKSGRGDERPKTARGK
jgi:hypothetical protein